MTVHDVIKENLIFFPFSLFLIQGVPVNACNI